MGLRGSLDFVERQRSNLGLRLGIGIGLGRGIPFALGLLDSWHRGLDPDLKL